MISNSNSSENQKLENILGDTFYYSNGILHREDGPAIEFCDGSKKWYYHGIVAPVTCQADFEKYINLLEFS